MPVESPKATLIVREHQGRAFYEAFWRFERKQVKRRLGPAWLEPDPKSGEWRRRHGRKQTGFYDEAGAHVAAAQLVAQYLAFARPVKRDRGRGPSPRCVIAVFA